MKVTTGFSRGPFVCSLAAAFVFAACAQSDKAPPAASGSGGNSGAGTGGAISASGGAGGSVGGAGGSGSGGAPAGSGGAAATGGAAGVDAAPDSVSSAGCVTMGSEFCDDFESGMLDMQKWKQDKPSASAMITVDGAHVHSGKFAAHIKVVAGQQSTAMISEAVTFPATPNLFYARMFVYFSPDIPVAQGADYHTGFLIGNGNNNLGNVQVGMGMIGSAKQWLGYSIFYANPKLEFGPWSKTLIMASQWQCVELFEDGSDPTTEKRQVWIDDQELTDLRSSSATSANGNANHLPPKFNSVSFGLWEYHPTPTLSDMWIDDVRVSSKKIGCGN
ncbi:MAG TPA: hypothetical protein VH374_23385 [Polyangia bacterium]|nr:hypothetical protein [Polyangia bacterium]